MQRNVLNLVAGRFQPHDGWPSAAQDACTCPTGGFCTGRHAGSSEIPCSAPPGRSVFMVFPNFPPLPLPSLAGGLVPAQKTGRAGQGRQISCSRRKKSVPGAGAAREENAQRPNSLSGSGEEQTAAHLQKLTNIC